MHDPGRKPITVNLFGEDLPLLLDKRVLRRVSCDAVPLIGPRSQQIWASLAPTITGDGDSQVVVFEHPRFAWHLVLVVWAALSHLQRGWTIDDIDRALDPEKSWEVAIAVCALIQRDLAPVEPDLPQPEGEQRENPTATMSDGCESTHSPASASASPTTNTGA